VVAEAPRAELRDGSVCPNDLLCGVSAIEKVQRQNDDRCYKQQVNQAAGDKATINPYQPEQQ